ncbi:P27 family phage terminase small subunit [Hominibacterium faecale]|uniref:P27 family phage terminase small subunit n=1 Tax=Hominibacterium faecale TaxID=2839743 RepID=UPI0022B2A948|nr:P27 family phage terminase small subunit [Hominibacterium faecale]
MSGSSDKAKITRKRNKIFNDTKRKMEALHTYKKEFETPIMRYAELRMQFDALTERWHEEGCKITEEYTNKAGAKNMRKTALYLSLETLRKELMEMENIFGLTPRGLKMIKVSMVDKTGGGKLAAAIEKLGG